MYMGTDFSMLEWEWLQCEHEIIPDRFSITREDDPNTYCASISSIRLWRDTQYQIQGCITGEEAVICEIRDLQRTDKSERIPKIVFSVSTHGATYTLTGCIFKEHIQICCDNRFELQFTLHNVEGKTQRSESDNVHPSASGGSIPPLEIHPGLSSPVKLSIWYIYGVHRALPTDIFSEYTDVCINSSISYSMSISSYTIQRTLSIPQQQEMHLNATHPINIEGVDTPLIIHNMNVNSYPPTGSQKMEFEYWKTADTDRFPDRDKWWKIGEIVGFILGKELIPVGYTIYDTKGNIVEFSSIDVPLWKNLSLKSECQGIPPIDLKKGAETPSPFETVLPPLAHQYLRTRDSLCLHEVLVRYWTGMSLPLGLNIPLIQNGIEILTKTSQGMDPAQTKTRNYVELFLKPMMQQFCLPLGTKEEKLSGLRNSMIHGMIDFNQGNIDDSMRDVYGYISFFHRIFLGALGYNGKYIDYSLPNFPSKDILIPVSDPISDPETQE